MNIKSDWHCESEYILTMLPEWLQPCSSCGSQGMTQRWTDHRSRQSCPKMVGRLLDTEEQNNFFVKKSKSHMGTISVTISNYTTFIWVVNVLVFLLFLKYMNLQVSHFLWKNNRLPWADHKLKPIFCNCPFLYRGRLWCWGWQDRGWRTWQWQMTPQTQMGV